MHPLTIQNDPPLCDAYEKRAIDMFLGYYEGVVLLNIKRLQDIDVSLQRGKYFNQQITYWENYLSAIKDMRAQNNLRKETTWVQIDQNQPKVTTTSQPALYSDVSRE
jgi:hypothetical protein